MFSIGQNFPMNAFSFLSVCDLVLIESYVQAEPIWMSDGEVVRKSIRQLASLQRKLSRRNYQAGLRNRKKAEKIAANV